MSPRSMPQINRRAFGGLAAGAAAAAFGAGATAQGAERISLDLYYPVAVGGQVTKVVESMTEAFNRSQERFKVVPVYTGSYDETQAKALTAVRAGNGPALAVLAATELFSLLDDDVIVPVEDIAARTGTGAEVAAWLAGFYPSLLENSRSEGKTYGIPFQRSTLAVFYNKDAFREAGLDPEKAPDTWEQTREFARKLVKRDGAGNVQRWGIQIPSSVGHPHWLFQTLAASNKAIIVNDDGTKVFLNQPGAVEALQFWVDLIKDQLHPPGIVEWGTNIRDFLEGRTAIVYSTSGNIGSVRESVKFPFGIGKAPMNKVRAATIGGANLFLLKQPTPEREEGALAFARFVSKPELAAEWSIATGYIATSPAAWQTPAMLDYVKRYPDVVVPRDQLAYGVREISTFQKQRVNRVLNDAIQRALLGRLSPKETLDRAQQEIETVLKPYRR